MPFMLILVGLVLVITGIQNTYAALGTQLQKDFIGPKGFLVWLIALIAVGALGYVNGWERFSRYFLALILIAIILANSKGAQSGGFFARFMAQIKNPKAPPAAAATPPPPAPPLTTGSSDMEVAARDRAAANAPGGTTFGSILQFFNPFASTPAY